MNRYACHFEDNHGCIILNAKDAEEVAWLAEAHARIEGTRISDIVPLDDLSAALQNPYGE